MLLAEPDVVIGPQPGPQTMMMSSPADIVFFGGAAFGGKTFGLCLELARWIHLPGYNAVAFRRTYPEITNPGGLWDTSMQIYPHLGGVPKESDRSWSFPSGAKIKFAHMQHEKNKHDWQGSAVAVEAFDELTHFTKGQFFYMLSRNRLDRPLPIRPYIRASMNPDPNSWVRKFIDWWIGPDGIAIPERSGVIRWFARQGDNIVWADTRQELIDKGYDNPKSFTFIGSKITDNKIGMQNDPEYLGNLKALSLVERERLLGGNWNIKPTSGMVFKRRWFPIVKVAGAGGRVIRYWDRAATPETPETTKADYTAGVKMRLAEDGFIYIEDVCHFRGDPNEVLRAMRNCADQDGEDCEVWAEVDPGQAGKSEYVHLAKHFQDRSFHGRPVAGKGNKFKRALPFSAQCEVGNVKLVEGIWNDEYLTELEQFADWEQVDEKPTELPHDDQVDGSSGGYGVLVIDHPRVRAT